MSAFRTFVLVKQHETKERWKPVFQHITEKIVHHNVKHKTIIRLYFGDGASRDFDDRNYKHGKQCLVEIKENAESQSLNTAIRP